MSGVRDFAKSAAKSMAAAALTWSGLRRVLSRASRIAAGGRRVLVLSYHRVVEDFEAEAQRSIPGLLVSTRTFERHLDELDRAGFDVTPLGTAIDVLAGRLEPRRDVAVLTFDDGYRDVYENAFPVLRRRGLPATVYLASGYVGTQERFPHDRLYHLLRLALSGGLNARGRNVIASEEMDARAAAVVDQLISTRSAQELLELVARIEQGLGAGAELPSSGAILGWPMVREMAEAGIEFGAHTVRHVVLTHETEESLEREVLGSKREIEQHLGRPVVDFAYPNGYYDRRVVAALARHGFRSGVTTEDLPNHVGGDPFRLRRKTLWENFSRGPFGYSSALTACHLDDVFGLLALTHPVSGEKRGVPEQPSSYFGARA